ncbi:hypothetical protein KDD17_04085 [Sulfitobacter albidus]|uniref:Integrase catalytic domain-containing protein n=1 Tax=Sulfitobacter albidus TaxID=2829501 RepID=A0A975PMV4_9RHOB|nr:hypothetical protein [Sulfitobacter albidus]QUJ77207.1 hypothetical protein KDD17_04085 [Sulfitobacter albidus]
MERCHQTMMHRVLPENHFLPGDLQRQIGAFVDHHDSRRCHESLDSLTPADIYYGRGAKILKTREEIKKQRIGKRRLQHHAAAAKSQTEIKPEPPFRYSLKSPKNSGGGHKGPVANRRKNISHLRSYTMLQLRRGARHPH